MKGIQFEPLSRATTVTPNRNDVACFVGLSSVRENTSPEWAETWLREQGWWAEDPTQSVRHGFTDLPIPLNSWEQFDELFAWDKRSYPSGVQGATYLGAAVRSFFAQGGKKCFVISVGEPLPVDADRALRDTLLSLLVPERSGPIHDRQLWSGMHHLLGLPEVSMLALPDLAELTASQVPRNQLPVEFPVTEPAFVECSESTVVIDTEQQVIHLAAPVCNDDDLTLWRGIIRRAVLWLANERRDTQLVAAFPQPHEESGAAHDLLSFLHEESWLSDTLDNSDSVASAFLQIAYPWLQMRYAGDLPANSEPPEGVMTGVLARNALLRGNFRSITALALHDAIDIHPQLSQSALHAVSPLASPQGSPRSPLIDRLALLGHTSSGIRWLSDVTTSNNSSHRQAPVVRTIALVLRLAQRIGEEFVLESSGEQLWQQLEQRMSNVLAALYRAGALRGERQQDGFQVRCDRSTHSQHQIDSGRVVVHVMIQPSACIETISIELSLGDGGRVSLSALGREAA